MKIVIRTFLKAHTVNHSFFGETGIGLKKEESLMSINELHFSFNFYCS